MKKKKRWEIVHEDDYVIVVEKPAPYLTIPDRFDSTIPNVYGMLSSSRERVFINHRIDKETSGLLMFTKKEAAHKIMSQQFESGLVIKHYEAITLGEPPLEIGQIDLAIGASKRGKKGMVITEKGKASTTKYRVIESWSSHSYLEVKMLTGRQHQIRVHLQAIGCPLVADKLYGDGRPFLLSEIKRKMNRDREKVELPLLSRHALHASVLGFKHPHSGEKMEFRSKLPKDMRAVVYQLGKRG